MGERCAASAIAPGSRRRACTRRSASHGPLHFDLYDRWNERAIAGATYHVVHPGGRASEERPVNAVAAEGRRLARFDMPVAYAGLVHAAASSARIRRSR